MTDTTKPRELTVATIDGMTAQMGDTPDGIMCSIPAGDLRSLLRQARAMAVMWEHETEARFYRGTGWTAFPWYSASASAGHLTPTEAIEAADAARRTK